MAYGFNDDKSKFDIDAALENTLEEAIGIRLQEFTGIANLQTWVVSELLYPGIYRVKTSKTSAANLGLCPCDAILTVYLFDMRYPVVIAKAIDTSSSIYAGLEYMITLFKDTAWTRNFVDILPGDKVSFKEYPIFAGIVRSSTTVRFAVPLGRKIRATTAAFVMGEIYVQSNGTQVSCYIGPAAEKASCVINANEGILACQITFNNAQSALVRNYPATIMPSTANLMEITFS